MDQLLFNMGVQRRIILLSGPIAVGKSTIARALCEEHGFKRIGTGAYLLDLAAASGEAGSRAALQALGDRLDATTDFGWLVDDAAGPMIERNPQQRFWLLDSVRKARQVEHFRRRFGREIFHVHLTASEETLAQRYEKRLAAGGEYEGGTSYAIAISHPNEMAARSLVRLADSVVDATADEAVRTILKSLEHDR